MKTCECGCGKETLFYEQTDNKRGYKKGQPKRFFRGHNLKAKGWSPISSFCVSCGTNDKKHQAKGMCDTCYKREWEKTEKGIATKKRSGQSLRHKLYSKKYYLTHKQQANENAKKWILKYPEKRKVVSINCSHRRRSDMEFTDITKEFLIKIKFQSDTCPVCKKTMDKGGKYPNGRQLDHILPLYRGGLHLRSNVRYICARCNLLNR